MSFTEAQKKDIRKYLGVPFGFYNQSHRLEGMMDKVGGTLADRDEIASWLDEIATIDTTLSTTASSSGVAYGALRKVDEVEFFSPEDSGSSASTGGAAARGRTLIQRIARSLGVDDILPNGDYFSQARGGGWDLQLG